jgi:hypothetical protein
MQLIEICFIGIGALLLALAFYLGRRQPDKDKDTARDQAIKGISPEKAVRLQTSLMQLFHELQTLGNDMSLDLEKKLSELKELLHLADTTRGEESTTEPETESSAEPDMEERGEREEPEPLETEPSSTVEEEIAPPPLSHRYSEIFQMAEAGFPIEEIARRMHMGKGEIQLILSLRQKD